MRWPLALMTATALLLSGLPSAYAMEVGADLLWWQYEEIASDTKYVGAPFHSKARTLTLQIRVADEAAISADWKVHYLFSSLIPTVQATERWPRVDFLQTNDLRIGQLDARLALVRRLRGVDVGLFGALRWQQQARQNFRKNGALLPDSLVTETIRSAWVGGLVAGHWGTLSVALPTWVRTTNSSITNVFRNKQGFRLGAALFWPLDRWLGEGFRLRGSYHLQQFSGEAQPNALWPENRFQTISLGVDATW